MSLVGSLEDLALGDILQIVSLSRKSGLLLLRSDEGDGRIFFRDGLVQAAYVKGQAEDLRALLMAGGFSDGTNLDGVVEAARTQGRSAEDAIAACSGLSEERLEALRREHVERAVLCMFRWRVGEFSFEVRDDMDAHDLPLALPNGMNAQYLTMEATRLGDEGEDGGDALGDDFLLSGEVRGEPEAPEAAEVHEAMAIATSARVPEPEAADATDPDLAMPQRAAEKPEAPAAAAEPGQAAELSQGPGVGAPPEAAPAAGSTPAAPPLVVIDPQLAALEWIKSSLTGSFARVHIFQHSEGGIARVRQYLSRAVKPMVLVSTRAPADTLTGAADVRELLSRLRSQAPHMPIVAMCEGDDVAPAGVDAADALVRRPPTSLLTDPKHAAEADEAGVQLEAALRPWAFPAQARMSAPPAAPLRAQRVASADASLHSLEDMSERLRDRATRGEVLNLVLDFAAEHFRRVAMFMVREDEAVGIAQRGLPDAGGPDDEVFLALRVDMADCSWFRSVAETGESLRAGPSDEGDRRLAALLGSRPPLEAFVAPIESGGRVAALLYGDNLPEASPVGDTTVLSIVLHEAGLALERAVLERALASSS